MTVLGVDVTLLDVLDIVLVFLLLYGCYLFIRGTRALALLGGVLVLFGMYVAANLLELRAVNFLFQSLWSVGLIFLIVVFQDEIRSALMSLGKRRWSAFGELPSEQVIDTLTKSVENLSKREVGALMVIEQEVGLKSYVKTGSEVDARLSSELLTSLFMSKGPLHDGAVILREERVVAAGCILPLSDQEDLPREFGTRHRAAVGISEETDALVVVVSEETGAITYAHRGQFRRDISVQELEDLLYEEMVA